MNIDIKLTEGVCRSCGKKKISLIHKNICLDCFNEWQIKKGGAKNLLNS